MPSQQHEILVEMFRHRPALACDLLRHAAGLELDAAITELGSNDLSQAIAIEYRADAVTLVRGADRRLEKAIIVEVQLRSDRDKRLTWPLYIAALRARLQCPVMLLVVATRDSVVRWARRRIPLGHPGFVLEPVVVGFADLPRVVDPVVAREAPELGVLSVMAHRDLAVARVVAPAILEQPEKTRQVYLDLIFSALPTAAERSLKELLMEKYQYQSNVVREYVAQGREEGREEGLREAVLVLARTKLSPLPAALQAAVTQVRDTVRLSALVDELGRARDAADVEAILGRVASKAES